MSARKKSQWYEIGYNVARGERGVCEPPPVSDFYLGIIDGVKTKQAPHLAKTMCALLIEAVKTGLFMVPQEMQAWFENLQTPKVLEVSDQTSSFPTFVEVKSSRIPRSIRELGTKSSLIPKISTRPHIRNGRPDLSDYERTTFAEKCLHALYT